MRRSRLLAVLFPLLIAGRLAFGGEPWYIDDEGFMDRFETKLTKLVEKHKCLAPEEIKKKLANRICKITLAQPRQKPLAPEEVYQVGLKSVFVVGELGPAREDPNAKKDALHAKKDDPHAKKRGIVIPKKLEMVASASAFALTEDGIMMTNWHVFQDLKDEHFGVANSKGEVFPVIDILGSNQDLDIALIRVAGKGFTPLAFQPDEKVAAWIGVLSHPGGMNYTFTQGYVTRYLKTFNEHDKCERWMSITADYAVGSSGAPVLNRFGNVVGMATVTSNIDADSEEHGPGKDNPQGGPKSEPKDGQKKTGGDGAKKPPAGEHPEELEGPPPSAVQMVVKLAIPGRTLLDFCEGKTK